MTYVFNPFTGNLDAVGLTSSGAGKTLTSETPTGAIDGSNNIYTVLNEPVLVEIDGSFRVAGYGYTYAAGTITVDPLLAPVQSIVSFYNA